MKCPICDIDMRISDREGIEIDYCPQCRGVWLDRGELEKIIAKVDSQLSSDRDHDDNKPEQEEQSHFEIQHSKDRRKSEYSRNEQYNGKEQVERGGQKREGFFSNLFDMFGD
jgi:Zn-finger nucleic acid-binding protein